MRRYVVFGLAAPVVLWLGFIAIGRKRADAAGTAVFADRGLFLNMPHGLAIEASAAGTLAAYLTKGLG